MRINQVVLVILCAYVVFTCSKDDEQGTATPPRDRAEQQASDSDSLQNYLNTHYYNSGALSALPTYPEVSDIKITKLEEGQSVPDNATLLADAVEQKTTVYQEVDYTYYILKLEEGQGHQPHFTDQVRVNYEGFLLNGTSFDNSVTPVDVDLVYSIPGWNRVLPEFRASSGYTTNGDGTISFNNYGVGVMFLPSGLSYFNNSASGIPSYSCLVFKFALYQFQVMDHDNDLIPSYMEDDNDNIDVTDDNTDEDRYNNFLDTDDDGDGYQTFREITYLTYNQPTKLALETELMALSPLSNQFISPIVKEEDGSYSAKLITLEDTNGNGIPNYLDVEDAQTLN